MTESSELRAQPSDCVSPSKFVPASDASRQTLTPPALVIGHPRDPVHPFSDADMLAHELPNARLIDADSLLELRLRPERLTARIAEFIGECWRGEPSASAARAVSA